MISHKINRIFTLMVLTVTLLATLAASAQPRRNDGPDTPGTGSYPAMKEEVVSLPDHVVYRPVNIAAMCSLKMGSCVG